MSLDGSAVCIKNVLFVEHEVVVRDCKQNFKF